MKIFVSHSKDFDFKSELYEPIKNSALSEKHEFFLPHDEGRNQKTKEEIKNSDLFVVEISYPSRSSGIEIGWADAFNVPIVAIHREDYKPSGSIRHVTEKVISYKDTDDLVNILKENLI